MRLHPRLDDVVGVAHRRASDASEDGARHLRSEPRPAVASLAAALASNGSRASRGRLCNLAAEEELAHAILALAVHGRSHPSRPGGGGSEEAAAGGGGGDGAGSGEEAAHASVLPLDADHLERREEERHLHTDESGRHKLPCRLGEATTAGREDAAVESVEPKRKRHVGQLERQVGGESGVERAQRGERAGARRQWPAFL
mmetsp:Transcript_30258/g.94956  ORF Transcript_30258/g.94956 Transcript_30258/m.94956 type:complete len:200 (+) Transcript_30258:409-1008(+)